MPADGRLSCRRSIDLFELSKDQRSVSVWTWDHGQSLRSTPSLGFVWADLCDCLFTAAYTYRKSAASVIKPHKIHNVVPMDFNGDGRLDLLVMSEAEDGTWWTDTSELQLDIHVQVEGGKLGTFCTEDGSCSFERC